MKTRAIGALGAGALVALGIAVSGPAGAVQPLPGTAGGGNAMAKAQPKGQVVPGFATSTPNDKNRGFRCDDNPGVGDGNPAFAGCDEGGGTPR